MVNKIKHLKKKDPKSSISLVYTLGKTIAIQASISMKQQHAHAAAHWKEEKNGELLNQINPNKKNLATLSINPQFKIQFCWTKDNPNNQFACQLFIICEMSFNPQLWIMTKFIIRRLKWTPYPRTNEIPWMNTTF